MFGLRKSKGTDAAATLGIELCDGGIAVSALNLRDSKPHLHWCEWLDTSQVGSVQERVEALVDRRGVDGLKSVVVLPVGDYQLHRLPKPTVPDAEMRQALRWQLRDLVDFPLAEAVVDVFPVLPGMSNKSGSSDYSAAAESASLAEDVGDEVFVVVARQRRLETHANTLRAAGLEISAIEIPELAMARLHGLLNQRLPNLSKSISALLHTSEGKGLLAVCQQETLLMARELHAESPESRASSFDLSFDDNRDPVPQTSQSAGRIASALTFFNDGSDTSHRKLWHLPSASANEWWPEVVAGTDAGSDALSNISLEPFDYSRLMTGAEKVDVQLQSRCLLSVAAALRGEVH